MNFAAVLARNGDRMITWQAYNINGETTFTKSHVAESCEFNNTLWNDRKPD